MSKSFNFFSVSIILFFATLHTANSGPTDPVTIPDAALRAALETELGKTAGATITEAEMNDMTGQLNVQSRSISNLTGLEHATGITSLLARSNSISDLSPLSGLTQLTTLNLDSNPMTALSALKDLVNLTRLSARRSVTGANYRGPTPLNLSFLTKLTKLEYLALDVWAIQDVSVLENLTALEELYLRYNHIADISPLRGLTSLTVLQLTFNFSLTDISPLGSLTALETLHLNMNSISRIGSRISDISALKNLTKLKTLWLHSTNITADGLAEVLPSFSAMEYLILDGTRISDLSVLDHLPSEAPLRNLSVRHMHDPPGAIDDHGWLLKDLTPLVELIQSGDLSAPVMGGQIEVRLNWNLDYDSIYTDIPALIKLVPATVKYSPVVPGLRRRSEEHHIGRPRTEHTFRVSAYSTFSDYRTRSYYEAEKVNEAFAGVPVTWKVTAPDGTETETQALTGDDGLVEVTITLGNHGETHRVEAVVPANERAATEGPSHPELKVTFTATADRTAPPPPRTALATLTPLTVTFADYPEEKPIDEFTLTVKFSEPVIGFEKADITVDTELTSGKGEATLVDLTPETPIHPDRPDPEPIQTYTATVQLPDWARGTVTLIVRKNAAIAPFDLIGPEADTPSDPIEFGRRRVIVCPPSVVPMDRVIFNEFRNASDDIHDWIELKNISDEDVSLAEWEVSLVVPHAISPATPQWEILAMDRDVVAFGDSTLPAGGILLIVNTHPSETDLIRGQNIENPNSNPDLFPKYLIAPEMRLPNTPYLLILRSVRDQNGKYEGFEDLAGDYHKDDVNYATNVWPLRCTPVYTGTAAQFTVGDVYQRVMAPKFSANAWVSTLQPEKRGYLKGAWTLSDSHGGLGYDPGASAETSLGTPGYPVPGPPSEKGWGSISFSEVMYATNDNGGLSQWIELYNSTTEIVDLTDWRLVIEARDSKTVQRWASLRLKSLHIGPNQTVLLVGRKARSSGNIPTDRIYDLYRRNIAAFRRLGEGANRFLGSEGFALRLFSRDGVLVDVAGNLDGRRTPDKPKWELPEGWTETGKRTSLIRAYDNRVPGLGTVSDSFVRAADTALLKGYSYWGLPTDNGTPGYRQGSPLPVTVSSVRASRTDTGVVVNWTTVSEMENAGFYVLRSQHRTTGFVRVTPSLILGAGTTAERHTYTYTDTTAQSNVPYYYRLEEVSLSGERRAVTTVRLRGHLSAAGKSLGKWADVKELP